MSLAVRCDRCGKSQSVPDSLVGEPIICSYCGQQVIVAADAPLMPPPLPGAAPVVGQRAASPLKPVTQVGETPTKPAPVTRPPQRSLGAVPMSRPGVSPSTGPPTAPPPATPPPIPLPAPPRRDPPPGELVLETYERAVRLQKTSIWPWIFAGAMATLILIAVIVALVIQQAHPNPSLESVTNDPFVANAAAVSMLGPRQTGLGYSLQLPVDFVPAAEPSIAGMPAGTKSIAWVAKPGTESAGSLCRIWRIPQALNIDRELQNLHGMGGLLDHSATIQNKSTYHRLGETMLAVRGLVDGSDATAVRKGVIYLLADGRHTAIVVGMATGPKVTELQAQLDHAIRTLQPASPPVVQTSTQAAISGT